MAAGGSDAQGGACGRAPIDRDGFVDVYLSTVQAVFRLCVARVGAGEAEDAVSVVYLEAWRLRERAVEVDGSWLPWVLSVAENCCRTWRRSRHRHEARLARFHQAGTAPSGVGDHAEAVAVAVDSAERDRRVRTLIDALPHPLGYVARRCLLEEATSVVVAEELGSTASTVRGQLAEARRRLVAALRRAGDGPDGEVSAGHLPGRRPTGAGWLHEGTSS